jgi:lipid-A-disaccharide synthase
MGRAPQIFVVAGEPSADKHAAHLGEHLARVRDVELVGVGQAKMREAGFDLVFDSTGWSGIGVLDSLRRVPKLLIRIRQLTARLLAEPPDLLVLIDFGAFNVRLARRLRARLDCPILYYFPPRSWSREADYSGLADLLDRVATPFPWSKQRLLEAGIDAEWVGHPVVDRIHPPGPEERAALRAKLGVGDAEPVIGLLPGSRNTEIRCNAPQILGAASTIAGEHPEAQLLLSVAPSVSEESLRRYVERHGPPEQTKLVGGLTEIVEASDLVISTSGTATLETAAAGCPMVIVYRGNWWMAVEKWVRRFAVPMVGMPNILADEMIVPELLAGDAAAENIARTVLELLGDEAALGEMKRRLEEVRAKLGSPGVSERVAQMALEMIRL